MTAAEKYVAAAYLVVFLAVVVWVVIISAKLARLERELTELTELAERRRRETRVEERAEVTSVG